MNFKLAFCLLLAFCFGSSAVKAFSGEYKQVFAQAESYFENENYTAALPLYKQLDSMQPGSENIAFKIGLCYLNSPTYKTKSIPYFEKAITNISSNYEMGVMSEKAAPLSTYYYLGKAYHLNYEFDKAIEMYQKYLDQLGTDPKLAKEIAEIKHDIETCNNGKELIKTPKKITVTNLGGNINSKYADYSPVVSLDEKTLIFTSRRAGGTSNAVEANGLFFEDIYISNYENDEWQPAMSIGPNINTAGHEATINLSPDGQKLLIYKDKNGNGDLYESTLNGSIWSAPEKIAAPVNSSGWESHACYTSDNRILYFVSDRAGGFGGKDIYKCLRLPNGDWGPAQNLGPTINTPYDEDGIFVHPDGKQIFFSSKGHYSMGGFDIFTSEINDENGNWSEPVNYGYPVNTPDDDVFLITTADGKRSYFSSDKEGGYGEKDIYMISFPENEPRDITILVGKILNKSADPIENNRIVLINALTKDTLQVLTANSKTGKFGTNLPIGNSYLVSYQVNGKELSSETLDAPKGQGYQVIKREIPYYGLNGIDSTKIRDSLAAYAKQCDPVHGNYSLYFKYNRKEIDVHSPEFNSFINALAVCIKNNPAFVIEIESSASNVPTSTYGSNAQLAEARAKNAESKIKTALVKKGFSSAKLHFENKPVVQGPAYQNDAQSNRAEYEKHQYIKVKTK